MFKEITTKINYAFRTLKLRIKSMMKKSLTLTELIVVICILGIIAVDTMISLSYRWKRHNLEMGFTKAYSTLMQVNQRMQADEGSVWDTYNYGDNNKRYDYNYQTSFQNAFMSYFPMAKECVPAESGNSGSCNGKNCPPQDSGPKNCVPDTMSYQNSNITNKFNGVGMTQKQFYTADGMLFFPTVFSEDPYILAVYVDTNGYNHKPNRAGYDLFMFQITPDDRLVTMGSMNSVWRNPNFCDFANPSNNGAVNGRSCAYRALTEKDYFQNLP